MKALAKLSIEMLNAKVTGSDCNEQEIEKLKQKGYFVYAGEKDCIDADIVVYSSAILLNNKELNYALKNNIKTYERSEFINYLSSYCDNKIFIAGAHGKSTTTALIMHCLNKNNKEFLGHVGADFIQYDSSAMYKGNKYFVSEACEYKRNFLKLNPDILAILNIDFDHPDTYKDIMDVKKAYVEFANKAKKYLIIPIELKSLFSNVKGKIITYGNENSDVIYKIYNEKIELNFLDKKIIINTKLINTCNVNNIIVAFIVLKLLCIDDKNIIEGINTYLGLKRRFEYLGQINNSKIYTDYAHHPKEIKQLLDTIYRIDDNPLIIFEPHTYSRTESLFSEFIDVFKNVNNLIFLPTFASREKSESEPVYDLIKSLKQSRFIGSYKSLAVDILEESKKYKTIVIVGAGQAFSAFEIAKNYMDKMVNI